MRILFLDDDPKRHELFSRKHCEDNLYMVSTVASCLDMFMMWNYSHWIWDEVHLDHDLIGIYQDSNDLETGAEVVRWIVKHKPKIQKIICHSYNEKGRKIMVDLLKTAGYNVKDQPFNLSTSNLRKRP